eukprot:TRINITY_DN2605_c0_g1_i1.p1 TRINITY_DN2605_c0_g1~~TRINITY_DN2605_c0_g1_i1.p1  ORF type:complete len:787 (+),score=208.11 TRINITY_DN2605_c0_g1_i1:42-2402(+)
MAGEKSQRISQILAITYQRTVSRKREKGVLRNILILPVLIIICGVLLAKNSNIIDRTWEMVGNYDYSVDIKDFAHPITYRYLRNEMNETEIKNFNETLLKSKEINANVNFEGPYFGWTDLLTQADKYYPAYGIEGRKTGDEERFLNFLLFGETREMVWDLFNTLRIGLAKLVNSAKGDSFVLPRSLKIRNIPIPSKNYAFNYFQALWPIIALLIVVFLFGNFGHLVTQIVNEKPMKVHFLACGLQKLNYWIGVFIVDFVHMLIIILTLFIPGQLSCLFETSKIFIFARIPISVHLIMLISVALTFIFVSCIFSFIFSDPKTASVGAYLVALISVGAGFIFTTIIFNVIDEHSLLGEIISFIFRFPPINLLKVYLAAVVEDFTITSFFDTFAKEFWLMVAFPFFLLTFLIIIEVVPFIKNKVQQKKKEETGENKLLIPLVTDKDIFVEEEFVLSDPDKNALYLNKLSKHFGDLKAVDELTLGVRYGEVLGLLGPNGSGKTTTIKTILGLLKPTSGDYKILGVRNSSNVSKDIGFCPQDNIYNQYLTVEEHIRFFCMMRGIFGEEKEEEIKRAAELLKVLEILDQRAGGLSGAQKRKLMILSAIVGSPKFLILDECTAGFDPTSRRYLWNIIHKLKRTSSILLTTHSMQEAAELSTRVAIITKGKLRCIGTPQHLISRFGEGYTLSVLFNEDPTEHQLLKISEDLNLNRNYFEISGRVLECHIAKKFVKLSAIFNYFNKSKDLLNVSNWQMSQSTLEDVFLKFAKDSLLNDDDDNVHTFSDKKSQNLN